MAADGVTAPDAKANDLAKDRAASPDRIAATPTAAAAAAPVSGALGAKTKIGDHMKARLAAVASGAPRTTARAAAAAPKDATKDATAAEPSIASPGAKARALLKDRAAARQSATPAKDQAAAAEPSATRAGAKRGHAPLRPAPPQRAGKAVPSAPAANTRGGAVAKDRPQARATRPSDLLEPVLATAKDAATTGSWTEHLVLFLRVMAAVSLVEGIYHWAALCGIGAPAGGGFEQHTVAWRTATVFFAVIDLVAGVGLWLAAAWGAVVWLTAVVSMAVVEVFFPQVYGGSVFIVLVELALVGAYLWLAIVAARERPA
jgi:hypothetical protein